MRAIHPLCLASLAAAFCLTGCSSFAGRSNEKAAAYDSLSTGTQQRLERGKISIGDTPEMVYVAMGNPDQKLDETNANGQQAVWIYQSNGQQAETKEPTGWRQVLVPAIHGRNDEVIHESVTHDVNRTQVNEGTRVAFTGGVVSSVEQLKR